jgi:hypothetical protein
MPVQPDFQRVVERARLVDPPELQDARGASRPQGWVRVPEAARPARAAQGPEEDRT